MADELKFEVASRATYRTSVTKIFNELINNTDYDEIKLNVLTKKLNSLSSSLSESDIRIAKLKFEQDSSDSAKFQKERDECEVYQDRIHESLHRISVALNINGTTVNNIHNVSSTEHVVTSRSILKSPTAPLPVFNSGPDENFELFIRNFEATVGKYNYSAYDKFLLLRQQVKGKALYLIESLDPDNHTYNQAKELLTSALASRAVQVAKVLKQLSEMKLSPNGEPFKYIGDMKKIIQSTKQLNIEVNEILNFYFLEGLNEQFRTQLVMITNTTRPTLDQFLDNFFEANDRYSHFLTKKSAKPQVESNYFSKNSNTTAMALNVNVKSTSKSNPFAFCPLCPEGNNSHPVNKCSKFASPPLKLAKLEKINSCTRCMNPDHYAKHCNFRFKRSCGVCDGWHFSFLCPKFDEGKEKSKSSLNSISDKPKPPKLKTDTAVGLVVTICNWANYQPESILSTFTCNAGNSTEDLRCLRDSGSQNNFVLESKLEYFDYEIIDDNVTLKVDGINNSKEYLSKLVKIDVKLGNEFKTIEAFTFPAIHISLNLPGLSNVVQSFVAMGYQMADKLLLDNSDSIADIDLILGADAAYCFYDQSIHFGSQSVFHITQLGVMLIGNIKRLLSDIEYLPPINVQDECVEPDPIACNSAQVTSLTCAAGNTLLPPLDILSQTEKAEQYNLSSRVELDKCDPEILEDKCNLYLNKETNNLPEDHDLNSELVQFLLDNVDRGEDGRIIMPILWNDKVKHLLAQNFQLAKNVLHSNIKKFSKNESKLNLINANILELQSAGIIEKLDNVHDFIASNPTCSFLAFMPIFKLDKQTTKCRLVFLSNLSEKNKDGSPAISHNMAMYSGPCMNQKLTTALLLLRFDLKLLVFDLKKAFCQILLPEKDQNKLLFLWVKDLGSDHSIVAFRNLRCSFGLRPSPTMLMVSLFKIVILDTSNDHERLKLLKKLIYSLIYMDNGAITMNNSADLKWAYQQLTSIFQPYGFELQQLNSNDSHLNTEISAETQSTVDLFGLRWDTVKDELSTKPKKLDPDVKTKRQILSCIAENYDPYNMECPLLNRARLFLHRLQCRPDLGWDETLSSAELREWKNISNQVNNSPSLTIPRYVGSRDGEYRLIAFTDSSKLIYGTVIYIQCISTNAVQFLMAKNRLVGRNMETKTIPSLEFAAIMLGVETLVDLRKELSGPQSVIPIKIKEMKLYTDNMACLCWIQQYVRLEKMNKKTVFIQNRLQKLDRLCENNPIVFSFIDGINNPSDLVTRSVSYRQLKDSNYLTGPDFLVSKEAQLCRADILCVTVPDKIFKNKSECTTSNSCVVNSHVDTPQPLVDHSRFSSWGKLINVYSNVFKFIHVLKCKIEKKKSNNNKPSESANMTQKACNRIIQETQIAHFPEVMAYFSDPNVPKKSVPNLISQLNLFIDRDNVVRVGGKMNRKNSPDPYFPILLPKSSWITKIIVRECHFSMKHSGVYVVLSHLRRQFWIPNCFTTVKKILKDCIVCRRFNNRTLKLNQSPYKNLRLNPTNMVFNFSFIDYAGPFFVKINGVKSKVYLLIITCLWSRAINIKISLDLTTKEFLRSLQLHCFEYGVSSLILSDMGSSFLAGADIITNFLDDQTVKSYLESNNMQSLSFEHYYKGCNKLGSLVESCVKLTKRLLSASIKKNVLDFHDFEFAVMEARHIVNRRPIAFKEALRDPDLGVPKCITPESLIHGHDLQSVNLIPPLQPVNFENLDPNYDPVQGVHDSYKKLRKVRENLIKIYNEEFLYKLLDQSVNEKSRYEKVTHKGLEVDDLILLKEENMKPSSYPLCRVKEVTINDLGEATGAILVKGCNGETIKRHSSCIIPLLQVKEFPNPPFRVSDAAPDQGGSTDAEPDQGVPTHARPKRVAAVQSGRLTKQMLKL